MGVRRSGVRRSHLRRWSRGLCAALLLVLAVSASPVQAESEFARRSGQAFDLIVLRPLGAGKLVFGFFSFLPVALFAEIPVVGWNNDDGYSAVGDVWNAFVVDPFHDTFTRPLGEYPEE
jgi:hypothetical protein